jgi:cell division protein FtsQ
VESRGVLALRQVDVVGNRLVDKAAVLEKAGLELGVKLPFIKVAAVESSLRDLPGVGRVEVKRMYPSRIEIRIIEKEPVAMGYARGWHGLASDGSRIAGLDWNRSDLPVVDGFAALDAAACAALGAFLDGARRDHPELFANFSQLSFRAPDNVEIILRDRRLKVLLALGPPAAKAPKIATGKADKSLISLEFLRALQDQQAAALEPGRTVDLRVEGFAYVR